MSVRLTSDHPTYGAEGTLVTLDDPQAERNLITAGYAVAAYKAPAKAASKPAKATKAAGRRRSPRKAVAAPSGDVKAVD